MGQASTEMRVYQETVIRALKEDQFTAEEVKTMLLDAVRFMNPNELDRLLALSNRDRYDLT